MSVLGLAEAPGDYPAHDQRQTPAPVVGGHREITVRPAGVAVGLSQVAQFGGGEGIDRAQGTDRP
jgi:hypothetical protein